MSITTHILRYGETNIEYTLTYAARKTVAIDVHPDGTVVVKAPDAADLAAVENFVRRRAPWILRKQREFARYPAEIPARRYISGESFTYLGRQSPMNCAT
jgi:predicted metal-dependent hydrolase